MPSAVVCIVLLLAVLSPANSVAVAPKLAVVPEVPPVICSVALKVPTIFVNLIILSEPEVDVCNTTAVAPERVHVTVSSVVKTPELAEYTYSTE